MSASEIPTCWLLIRGAADGSGADREEFARRYMPVVQAYLRTRWRGSPHAGDVEDAAQEVFIAMLRSGGPLESADPEHGSGFRALLFAVTRNVALHHERSGARRRLRIDDAAFEPDLEPADEPSLSYVFDRAFAESVVRQARTAMDLKARSLDAEHRRRVELLRLHFEEGLPIPDIAARWQMDPAQAHREYARARREFRDALTETVAGAERWSAARVEQECERLLLLLRG